MKRFGEFVFELWQRSLKFVLLIAIVAISMFMLVPGVLILLFIAAMIGLCAWFVIATYLILTKRVR